MGQRADYQYLCRRPWLHLGLQGRK